MIDINSESKPRDDEVTFRRSIWDFDTRYEPPPGTLSAEDLHDLALLQSIEAAKKRTPPAAIAGLLNSVRAIRSTSTTSNITCEEFAQLLADIQTYGIGIKTAVCMLAVVTQGAFAPMDDKLSQGLLRLGKITNEEHRALNGLSRSSFAEAYVLSVLPAWRDAVARGIKPRTIDAAWANARET